MLHAIRYEEYMLKSDNGRRVQQKWPREPSSSLAPLRSPCSGHGWRAGRMALSSGPTRASGLGRSGHARGAACPSLSHGVQKVVGVGRRMTSAQHSALFAGSLAFSWRNSVDGILIMVVPPPFRRHHMIRRGFCGRQAKAT